MNRPDRPAFVRAMSDLALAMNVSLVQSTVDVYWSVLAPLPVDDVVAACKRAAAIFQHWPTAAQLRTIASKSSTEAETDDNSLAGINHAEEQYWCSVCDDTGFVRRMPHPEHLQPITRKCECRAMNPWLIRQRALVRKGKGE